MAVQKNSRSAGRNWALTAACGRMRGAPWGRAGDSPWPWRARRPVGARACVAPLRQWVPEALLVEGGLTALAGPEAALH